VNITSELEDNLFRVGIDISGEFYGDICKPEMGHGNYLKTLDGTRVTSQYGHSVPAATSRKVPTLN
jgi:hypothetical protein